MRKFRIPAILLLILAPIGAILCRPLRTQLKGNLLAVYDLCLFGSGPFPTAAPISYRMVAHAGGAFHGLTYTNSEEALDENYRKGFRVFELDFEWTSDSRLVMVHDWKQTSSLFGQPPHIFTYNAFLTSRRRDGLHQLTFEGLVSWLRSHPDAFVVTDTKASNDRLLTFLRAHGKEVLPQLVIQIYRLSELRSARELAPRAVWLTVYKSSYPRWALARISGIDAFVIPVDRYQAYFEPNLMIRTPFYVHSVAAKNAEQTLKRLPGVFGIYVD
jgi:glycerophosphoryl diester phosphodiesterase